MKLEEFPKEILILFFSFLDLESYLEFLVCSKKLKDIGQDEVFIKEKMRGCKVDFEQFMFRKEIKRNINPDRFFYAGSSKQRSRYEFEMGTQFPKVKPYCLCGKKMSIDHIFIERENKWRIDLCDLCIEEKKMDRMKKCRKCLIVHGGRKHIFCPPCKKQIVANSTGEYNQYNVQKCKTCNQFFSNRCQFCVYGRIFRFGKYYGLTIEEVKEKDPGYIKWLIRSHEADFNNPKSAFYRKVDPLIELIFKEEGKVSPSSKLNDLPVFSFTKNKIFIYKI